MGALAGLVDKGLVAPDWAEALAPVDEQITLMGQFLREEIAAGRGYLPEGDHILRAFGRPLSQVKVLIVGQDPYPTPGHPVGLSFSVATGVAPPKSLVNIFTELVDDLGVPRPTSGDLTPWADAGVMLLNRSLTVCSRPPGLAPRARLGAGHRPGDPDPRPAREGRRPPDRDPLGPRRPVPEAGADPDPLGRVGAPEPALRTSRLLRVAAVQPGQPDARGTGRYAGRLASSVIREYSCRFK